MHLVIEAIGFGIATGAVIALGAVGFSVQFGISNILNITYGALMTLAAYVGLRAHQPRRQRMARAGARRASSSASSR